jgi:hypothetical protein
MRLSFAVYRRLAPHLRMSVEKCGVGGSLIHRLSVAGNLPNPCKPSRCERYTMRSGDVQVVSKPVLTGATLLLASDPRSSHART